VDWNAGRYHRLSEPQVAWGREVLARLDPQPGERILDIGCGTGRLTGEVAARTRTLVIGMDRSAAMLAEALAHRAGPVAFVRADGAALPFRGGFDAVFSTATFHWILDHDRLFAEVLAALRPGGRLVAQCGGGPNLAIVRGRARSLMESARFNAWFDTWSEPWYYAGVDETRARLAAAGFNSIDVSLHPAPTTLPDAQRYADFISCVCVRHHVDALPVDQRAPFVAALADAAARDDPPFTLDYWRLNVAARRPA
jgi:trans-aconitate 2-methyltransferase